MALTPVMMRDICFNLLRFVLFLKVKRLGTGDQGHHSGSPPACFADVTDASQPADPHPGRCTHATACTASALYQPGMFSMLTSYPYNKKIWGKTAKYNT